MLKTVLLISAMFARIGKINTIGFITKQGEVLISEADQDRAINDEMGKCYEKILFGPNPKGLHCNRTFDSLSCWPDTPPGVLQYLPCPNYINGFTTLGNATRQCMTDGHWYFNPAVNMTWSNYSQCMTPTGTEASIPPVISVHIEYIMLMYNTGYAISVVSLLLAVYVMIHYKKLHCPRNIVHINMFVSFILRAIVSFLKDILFVQGLGFSFDVRQVNHNIVEFIEQGSHWECKLLYSLFQYVFAANYMWVLVEGLYLHTLVYVSVFSERSSIRYYYLLGWGTPFLSIIPWVVVRVTKENIYCWNTNPTAGYFWILKGPIILILIINFIFFINILRALFTKLHHKPKSSSARRNRYRRLAKATLILIPMFGVHYLVFIGFPDDIAPTTEIVKLYIEMFFNSIQGFVVAVLFCFFNREVQMEIKKSWYRLWSKPDPVYIQQYQQIAISCNGTRRRQESRSNNHEPSENHPSLEGSSDHDMCLCKWTLNKNGKLRRSFIKPQGSIKSNRSSKKLLVRETKM